MSEHGARPGRAWPYELQVGWRYLRAGRAVRQNRYVSFIAAASILGIALGVAALVVVLSVVNGFSREVRERMLSVVPHVEVIQARGGALPDAAGLATRLRGTPGVVAVAPFVSTQVLVGRGDVLRGAQLRGITVDDTATVSPLVQAARERLAPALQPGSRHVVLGVELARQLGARVGEAVTLVLPSAQDGLGAATAPRLVPLTLAGTVEAGHYEYDSTLALMALADVEALYGLDGPTGLQLRLDDEDAAPAVANALTVSLPSGLWVQDWTRTHRVWFEAVQLQKRMLFLIVVLIVAVAAFNLVATLVMTVTDKEADIAILRTLGASPRSIMAIFMVQGAAAGIAGTAAGLALGLAVAYHVAELVAGLEHLLGTTLLSGSVYLIDHMPSDPQRGDIVPIALIALALAFVATLYPSWRAARLRPAEALRHG